MITQLQTYYRVALLEQSMQRVLKRISQRRAKKMQKEIERELFNQDRNECK